MKITQFQRKPFQKTGSVEGLFSTMRNEMNRQGCYPELQVSPWFSKGLVPRARMIAWARTFDSDVNHITGDIHFLTLGLKPSRTILTVLDLEMLSRLRGVRKFLLRLFWFDLPLKRCRSVTVISEETKLELMNKSSCPAEKISVIPCVADSQFVPVEKRFSVDCPIILQIGTRPNKNLTRLIEAVAGMNIKLHIIGKLTNVQVNHMQSLNIKFRNEFDITDAQMLKAYADADILSFVSTHEGFGMPILEAQWVERAVVTSNRSSMPEVAGKGACYVDPYDVDSIRNGIKQVIENNKFRDELLSHGRENRKRFSIAMVARQYMNLYQTIAVSSQ